MMFEDSILVWFLVCQVVYGNVCTAISIATQLPTIEPTSLPSPTTDPSETQDKTNTVFRLYIAVALGLVAPVLMLISAVVVVYFRNHTPIRKHLNRLKQDRISLVDLRCAQMYFDKRVTSAGCCERWVCGIWKRLEERLKERLAFHNEVHRLYGVLDEINGFLQKYNHIKPGDRFHELATIIALRDQFEIDAHACDNTLIPLHFNEATQNIVSTLLSESTKLIEEGTQAISRNDMQMLKTIDTKIRAVYDKHRLRLVFVSQLMDGWQTLLGDAPDLQKDGQVKSEAVEAKNHGVAGDVDLPRYSRNPQDGDVVTLYTV